MSSIPPDFELPPEEKQQIKIVDKYEFEECFGEFGDYCIDNRGKLSINAYDMASSRIDNFQDATRENIDVNSFELLSLGYFKDKNLMYYNSFSTLSLHENIKILDGIDPASVRVITQHCVADKKAVYCDIPYQHSGKKVKMKKVPLADPKTFNIDREKSEKYEKYFKDKNYHFENILEKGINIKVVK